MSSWLYTRQCSMFWKMALWNTTSKKFSSPPRDHNFTSRRNTNQNYRNNYSTLQQWLSSSPTTSHLSPLHQHWSNRPSTAKLSTLPCRKTWQNDLLKLDTFNCKYCPVVVSSAEQGNLSAIVIIILSALRNHHLSWCIAFCCAAFGCLSLQLQKYYERHGPFVWDNGGSYRYLLHNCSCLYLLRLLLSSKEDWLYRKLSGKCVTPSPWICAFLHSLALRFHYGSSCSLWSLPPL